MKVWFRRNRAGIIGGFVIALVLAVIYILTSAVYADALSVYWLRTRDPNECLYVYRGYTGYWQPQWWGRVYMCAVIR